MRVVYDYHTLAMKSYVIFNHAYLYYIDVVAIIGCRLFHCNLYWIL